MKFKIPGYPSYELKLTDRDKYLLTAFAALCVVLAWLAWRIID